MKSQKARNVRVVKNEENPETPEVLAEAIIKVSEGFEELLSQGLTKRGIVTLILGMDATKNVRKTDLYLILDNLPKLASYYVKR